MLYLTPIASEETDALFLEALEQKNITWVTEFAETLEDFIYHAGERLADEETRGTVVVHFPVAVDRDGNWYRDVTLLPTSTFVKDDDRWVSDGGVAVNLSAGYKVVIEAAREILS